MKRAVSFVIALLLLLPLCSCGRLTGLVKPTDQPEASPVPTASAHASQTPAPSETPSPSEKPSPSEAPKPSEKPPSGFGGSIDSTKPPSTQTPSPHPSPSPSPTASGAKTPLTAESLAYWKDYFAQQENYGFLLSSYDRPENVDLEQLFYAGAGIATWDVSQAEIDAYLDYNGYDELWGSLMKLTPEQIDEFMIDKTGVSLYDTTGSWYWVYLSDYDAWYIERSDTNYSFFDCVSGYKTADGTVVIECRVPDGYGQQVDKCTVTLKKSGDRYLFYSCKAHMTY